MAENTPRARVLDENEPGQRLHRFLRKAFRKTPLSLIHKLIRTGRVRVNGKRTRPDHMLQSNDRVEFPEEALREWKRVPRPVGGLDLRSRIIYEDRHLIALDKPAGLLVHPIERREAITLIDVLVGYLKAKESAAWSFKPALVHRLDAEASGLIVAAKNAAALRHLTAQFRERETEKEYYAVVRGNPARPQGRIDEALADRKGVPREALTEYRVEQGGEQCSLLRVRIHTGRLHQIRRHLAGIGHPIVGDRQHGGPGADRLYLHAWRLSLRHPEDGHALRLEAPLPREFPGIVSAPPSA